VETLEKLMSHWLRECTYYQPAVLVFDDLDAIAGSGNSASGQLISEENYSHTR
jgi:hypothetical protein